MKKRLLSLLLVAALLVFLMPAPGFASAEAASLLPTGYTQVEYVESHGQEWIDTGVIPTSATRSEVDFQVTVSEPTASMGIYGCYKTARHQIFYSIGSDQMTYGVGKGAAYTTLDTARHTAVLDARNASVTLDGVSIPSSNGKNYTSADATASIYLFGAHQPSDYSSIARLYDVKIYEDEELTHHYIPCFSQNSLEYGMYDTVSDIFLGNSSGAGTLSGPVKELALPAGYTQVEYVESHGQEWIDTGVIPTSDTRSEVDFQVTVSSPAASMGIYGVYRSTRHQILYSIGSDQMTYGVGKGAAYTTLDTARHTAILDARNASVTLDGERLPSDNGNDYSSGTASGSIYLFGVRQASNYTSYARLYDVKIYESNILIHHYIPCFAEASLEYGMFDTVIGTFHGNSSGAGQLTGPGSVLGTKVSLTAPESVTVKVYSGFDETTTGAMVCVGQNTVNGLTTYDYELPAGKYHFVSEGSGYYTWHKNFIVTPEDIASGGKFIHADPGRRSASGKYDCKRTMYSFTDELLASEPLSLDGLLARFPDLLDTPAFSPEKAVGEFTSQADMAAFLTSLDDPEDALYLFTAGKTGKGKPIYLTVHTLEDLTGLTMEEAANHLRATGKPIIYLYGLIHGLEPSGGEGALATIQALDGPYGDDVLTEVHVIVMPWINGDGAESYLYGTPSGCANLNRYNLTVDYPELQATHNVYNLFLPEVVISAHEKGFHTNGALDDTGTLIDVSLDISVNKNNTDQLRQLSKDMMRSVIVTAAEDGFRMDRHEQDNVNGQYPVVDTNYFGLRGSVSILVEVPGIRAGKDFYGRRVAAQFVSMQHIIRYVCENQQTVMSVVAADREAIAARGSAFDPNSLLTLRHGKNDTPSWIVSTPTYHLTDGTILDPTTTTPAVFWEESVVVRACPTAYVIPADLENLDFILRAADYNAIAYYYLTADEVVTLRQYGGTVTNATLGEESQFQFAAGAYVFPMNQPSGNVLAMLMEPDVYRTDSYAVSLAQTGKLTITDIYRCEQDLVNGMIPVTAIAHTYENGICTSCGEAEPDDHVPGDINGDGEVDNKDITRLFQYLSDYDVEVVEEALDINNDGEVNNKDLTRLFQYLSDYDVTIH